MFCLKVLLTIDRPRLKFRTHFNNRPNQSILTGINVELFMRLTLDFGSTRAKLKSTFNLDLELKL